MAGSREQQFRAKQQFVALFKGSLTCCAARILTVPGRPPRPALPAGLWTIGFHRVVCS
jgi:hypothetical protein